MARTHDLRHGEAADVAKLLDDDVTSVVHMLAALTNAMQRIDQLEKRSIEQTTKIGRLQRTNRSSFEA